MECKICPWVMFMKPSKKNILLIQNSIKTTYNFRQALIKQLIKDGHCVIVLAPNDCQSSLKSLELLGCSIKELNPYKSTAGFLSFLFKFNYIALKELKKCDYAFCFFISTFYILYFSLNIYSQKVTLSVEGLGSLFLRKSSKTLILKILFKLRLIVVYAHTLYINLIQLVFHFHLVPCKLSNKKHLLRHFCGL